MHGSVHLFDRLPQVDLSPIPDSARSAAPVRSEPLIGIIRNPNSHRNERSSGDYGDPSSALVASPSRRSELQDILADYANKMVDYIAIDGGDGTVRDVLTCGAGVFGEAWPALIVIPSGKTNALAHDLGIPRDWTLAQALKSAKRDTMATRRPLVVAMRENPNAQVHGFVMGGGAYTKAIMLGQEAHDLGAFNGAGVVLTVVWSAPQALFGRDNNPWRRGTAMRLHDGAGDELYHAGGASRSGRHLIFASTLKSFPAGLNPFRDDQPAGVNLAVMDNAHRSLIARLPAIIRGHKNDSTRRRGFHTHGGEEFALEIGDRFILDGEAFPAGAYHMSTGPRLRFVTP